MIHSHSQLSWRAAGCPNHGLPHEASEIHCATCGAKIPEGIHISHIETPTTSGHSELFRYGSKYVCDGCAWLFQAGKGRPGNFVTYGDKIEYTVISLESVVEDKRPWLHVLRDIAKMPDDTEITGVMTTDVKPRLWHRSRLARVGRFGLYVHAPDYDTSEWREFDLHECLLTVDIICQALARGYAKTSCYFGLLRDYARAAKDLDNAMQLDAALAAHRGEQYFIPALITAGVTKEAKGEKHDASIIASREPVSSTASSNQDHQTQLGLF